MNVPAHNHREPPGPSASPPVASPLDPPLVNQPMQPVRPVSPEAASMLPPVGLLSAARTPPPVARPADRIEQPSAPLPVAMPVESAAGPRETPGEDVAPFVSPSPHADAQRRWAAAGASSALVTCIMILTAVGVGAMAIIPALYGGGDVPEVVAASPGDSSADSDRAVKKGASQELHISDPAVEHTGPQNSLPSSAVSQIPDPERDPRLEAELSEIRKRLREQNIADAANRIQQLAARPRPPSQRARIEQHAALVSAVDALLANLQSALDAAGAGHTIHWRGRETPIVGVSETTVTILVDRRQVRWQRRALSAQAVHALAAGLLDMTDPRNQAQLGAWLFVAEEGGRSEARRLWSRAEAEGENVAKLLPLLQLPQ